MAVEDAKKVDDKTVVEPIDDLEAPEGVVNEPVLEDKSSPNPDLDKVHPLHPGGKRFEQVYAESKQAKRDLAKERDLRIAAEAKLSILDKEGTDETTDADGFVEYNWVQLEDFITQGRISRADAQKHREEVIERRLSKKLKGDMNAETKTATRSQALQHNINQYVEAVPAILVDSSEDRIRVDEEFDFLASVEGLDSSKIDETTRRRLQLVALRNVYGPVDVLLKRNTPNPEPHQGLPGGLRVQNKKNPDQEILDKLTKSEVAHYNKMMSAGRYPGGWKDVVAEIKFDPKAPRKARQ